MTNVNSNSFCFPGGSNSKESTWNVGDLGSIPGLERSPGDGHGNPLQHSCLENPHGSSSLVGYCLSGFKELDMTEGLSTTYKRSKHSDQKAKIDRMNEKPRPNYMASTMDIHHIKKHT